ncbi:MAG: hypothetical protein RJB01_72 [Actinomycetota bacterium]
MTSVPPAGWPDGVPAPSDEGFEERAVTWLLDFAPAEWRGSPIRSFPTALAWSVQQYLIGAQLAARGAYSRVRSTFGSEYPAATEPTLLAWEAHGAALAHTLRQVDMVRRALGGPGA